MDLQHRYHPRGLLSCPYDRGFRLVPSLYRINHPVAQICFRPAIHRTVLRWALNKALALVEASKYAWDFDLESEILAFMKNSTKPDLFPSKEELVAAGRVDLVKAILEEGGWLSVGWDSKEKDHERKEEATNFSSNRTNDNVFQNIDMSLDPEFRDSASFSLQQSAESSTSSAQLQEKNHDDGGVEGMLSRLEKERASSYASESREGESAPSRSDEARGKTRYSWEKLRMMYGGESRHSMGHGNLIEKLQELSNAWESKETEITKSRDKLRSTRAKFAILEGKMALELIEVQRLAAEKQRRIEKAQRILRLLRTASIVWSNAGEDVFVSVSFDGWTRQDDYLKNYKLALFTAMLSYCSIGVNIILKHPKQTIYSRCQKRRMERTSSGFFVINLKLYPGRYEVKFIVDGVWRIDPLRPVVNNNGHENNVLIVSH